MSEDLVNIEVDGRPLQARKGQMLIEVTDAAGIYIPRFCYHPKLSIAANCRMCLVEVERAPKPAPACATPVMEGMKVFTKSDKAVSGQKATMEFLLINHPLDCPICDQGGECELQDLALGYGSDVSQFVERKRVVRDKNIGPLVQTDMTRCIHCTRCVRFGEEVAGLRELGATGRGEHLEIGTYVEQAMTSELSGNVIDLCPVGALTSKPYRYSARAWELQQRPAIAPHDCVGSNLNAHLKEQVVKRIVPRENESVNETWISDRDRFSYQGLRHEQRLLSPKVKVGGSWQDCDWDTAFEAAREGLVAYGDKLGAIASPSSTNEEFFLLQRLVRGLGSDNIDHRLRQRDFSADAEEPVAPGLGFSLGELAAADAILIVGGYPRHDQPLVHHRVRQAAQRGAKVFVLDTLAEEYNFDLAGRRSVKPGALASVLDGLAGAGDDALRGWSSALSAAASSMVLVASDIDQHPARAEVLALAAKVAATTGSRLGCLTAGANAAGAWLAGAVPHRGPAGASLGRQGAHTAAQFSQRLPAYVLLGIEPDLDLAAATTASTALANASFVLALTAFSTPALEAAAHVMLPIALHAENEGTFVNAQGNWQAFAAAVKPPGDARAAWKIFRVLGEQLGLEGFDAVLCADVGRELTDLAGALPVGGPANRSAGPVAAMTGAGLELHVTVPLYGTDALVRRASSLQQMPQRTDELARVSPATLARLGVADGATVTLEAEGQRVNARAVADARVPDDVVWVKAASQLAAHLPAASGVTLSAAASGVAA